MNPEILPVLDEITAVLKKHDMTGIIIVGNRSHMDWRVHVEASWSCAKPEEVDGLSGVAIRIRCKREDFPSAEAQRACLERTIGMFVSAGDVMIRIQENIEGLLAQVSESVSFLGRSTREE